MSERLKLNFSAYHERLANEKLPAVTADQRVLAPEKVDQSRTVLMDMHSLNVAIHKLLDRPVPSLTNGAVGRGSSRTYGPESYDYTAILANVVQSLVLYEVIVVDSLLFELHSHLWEAYSLFPGAIRALYIPERTRLEVGARVDAVTEKIEPYVDMPPSITSTTWSALFQEAGLEKALVDEIADVRPKLVPPEYLNDEYANQRARNEDKIYLPPCFRDSSRTLPRAHFYLELSREFGVPLAVDPARSEYFRTLVGSVDENLRKGIPEKVVARFEMATLQPCVDQLAGFVSVNLSIPAVAEYVYRYSKNKGCSLRDSILEIRESRRAKDFRDWCARFISLTNEGRAGLKEQSEMLSELQAVCEVWRKDLKEDTVYKSRTINLEKIPWHIGDVLKALNMQEVKIRDPILSPAKKNSYFLFLNDLLRPL